LSQIWAWQRESRGRPTLDGKGKGRPSVRPMWLVAREDFITAAMFTAGALHTFSREIKAASAVARNTRQICAMTTRDDDVCVRRGETQGNRGARCPQTSLGKVMRAAKKAGHFGRQGNVPALALAGDSSRLLI